VASIQEVVAAALLDGSSKVTRRTEIYEADGTTLFADSNTVPRVISGGVNVSMDQDTRRSLDVVFDNSDGLLKHDPDHFWYDKIIKVYRGTEWSVENPQPRIIIIYAVDDIAPKLRALGFTDVTTNTTVTNVADVMDYDIIISNAAYLATTAANLAILQQAFSAGKSIFTLGNDDTELTVPDFYTSSIAKSDAATWVVDPAAGDNPFKGKWSTISGLGTDSGNLATALVAGVVTVGTFTWSAVARPVMVYKENVQGGRWFHAQAYWANTNISPFFGLVLKWLDRTAGLKSWETQVGEFMIDRIDEPNFPKTIKVTGRDYSKKLLKSKFSQAVTFVAGTQVDVVIRAIAYNGGITKFNLNSEGATINSAISFDRTTERWAAIQGLAAAAAVDCYFDPRGYLATRAMQDPSQSPATLLLATGSKYGNLVSYAKSSNDTRIYNRVIITSDAQDVVALAGSGLQVIIANTEPSSPTRVAKLGERDYFYTSSFFTSLDQMQRYGEKLLKIVALEEYNLDFEVVPFYWSEAGDILDFADPDAGTDEPTRFLLSDFSVPLGLGTMSGSGKRVTIVGQAT
jgi:hypothetical protein